MEISFPPDRSLAYVQNKWSYTPPQVQGGDSVTAITYTLGVNLVQVAATPAGRMELESTIAHEMIHAFMIEATTSGMFGVINDPYKPDKSIEFPLWFIEGMAQTASGPNPPAPDHPTYGTGGIILQIGAEYGEILEVPRFYLSLDALEMKYLDISTQDNAWDAIPVIEDADRPDFFYPQYLRRDVKPFGI